MAPLLRPEDFYLKAHRIIFRHMLGLGEAADLVTVRASLIRAGEYQAVGGRVYLGELLGSVAVARHARYYAGLVATEAKRRKAIETAVQILKDSWDPVCPAERIIPAARERLDAARAGTADEAKQFACHSMADLEGMDLTLDYIIHNAMVVGSPGVGGGMFKTLKTTTMLDLHVSMEDIGRRWLGHFPCIRKARSVYFSGEGGLVFARESLRRICHSKEIDLRDVDGFFICDRVPSLDNAGSLKTVADVLKDHGAEFATFDPFYLMLGAAADSASNVYAMGAMLGSLLRTCQDVGVTPIILHHFKRSGPIGQAPNLADLSQAGCAEFAGQWWLIGRQRPYDAERPGEHELILSIGSRAGFASKWALHVSEGTPDSDGGRYWRPELAPFSEAMEQQKQTRAAARESAEKEKAAKDLESDRRKVVAAMVQWGKPAESADIEPRVNIKTKRFYRAWVASWMMAHSSRSEPSRRATAGPIRPSQLRPGIRKPPHPHRLARSYSNEG